MQILSYLESIHPMSDELKEHLVSTIRFKTLSKKDYLLKAGHISREVCFIESGLLRCFYIKDDKEVSRWFMREGDVIFSISSFYDQKPGFEYIQALEDCSLYYITKRELDFIYKNFMEFNFIGRELTIKYHQLWDEQLYYLQMQNATTRYQWLLDNHPELIFRVPAKHIASWLGISEVTLSRIKSGKKLSYFNFKERKAS